MKFFRSVFKLLLIADLVLAAAFGIVLLFICFRPCCMYPKTDIAVDFLGKSREEVWRAVEEQEKKSGDGDKILIAGDYGENAPAIKPRCDFAWEYWFDKSDIRKEENEKELDKLLGRKEHAKRYLERRWLVFRRTFVFLHAYPFASGIALEFDGAGIVRKQYLYYLK